MHFPVAKPLVAVCAASLLACGCAKPPDNRSASTGEKGVSQNHKLTLDQVQYSSQRDTFYNELSVEIIRCVIKHRSLCRHPYLTQQTRYRREGAGDMPQPTVSYPMDMDELAHAWGSFDRYEYVESPATPVPVNARDPFATRIMLSSVHSSAVAVVSFSYKDGHLDSVSEGTIWIHGGPL